MPRPGPAAMTSFARIIGARTMAESLRTAGTGASAAGSRGAPATPALTADAADIVGYLKIGGARRCASWRRAAPRPGARVRGSYLRHQAHKHHRHDAPPIPARADVCTLEAEMAGLVAVDGFADKRVTALRASARACGRFRDCMFRRVRGRVSRAQFSCVLLRGGGHVGTADNDTLVCVCGVCVCVCVRVVWEGAPGWRADRIRCPRRRRLQALRGAAEKEVEANASLVEQLAGTPVVYGQWVQLYHLKSGKVGRCARAAAAEIGRAHV